VTAFLEHTPAGGGNRRRACGRKDKQRHRTQTRDAPAIGCVSVGDEYATLDVTLPVPDIGLVELLVANVQLQLLAYHVANDEGRSIDKPRNLTKSVTVD